MGGGLYLCYYNMDFIQTSLIPMIRHHRPGEEVKLFFNLIQNLARETHDSTHQWVSDILITMSVNVDRKARWRFNQVWREKKKKCLGVKADDAFCNNGRSNTK